MLSALIRKLGHDVVTVHDGAEALQISEGYRPDVVMLDIGMPGMNGYEVARRLRGRNRSPRPLIVAVTGWGKPEDELRSREAGFDVHLVKPVEAAQIRQVLGAPPSRRPAREVRPASSAACGGPSRRHPVGVQLSQSAA